jgi:UDP-N-acetylmuramyl pentapeptide phosphotransferase/UDP-N-acetylglucosamine-1-phosphate transferase
MLTPNRVELLGGLIAAGGIAIAQMWAHPLASWLGPLAIATGLLIVLLQRPLSRKRGQRRRRR